MNFRIADSFTDSLSRLTGDEQKAVKTTAFDLQMNPANPGMSFHKLDKVKDKNFWSVRVSSDIRLIVHRTDASLLLCYVDHHDAAYRWAERRKIERHPKTGAAQLVEIRETIREIEIPRYVEPESEPEPQQTPKRRPTQVRKPASRPFEHIKTDELLRFGVPEEWVEDVREADEDGFLQLADHLPGEAAEALLQLATGATPVVATPTEASADPFEHPDAQRRFRLVTDVEELKQALEFPWEKWMVFLHPAQRQIVERSYNGPARVAGSAGTGKTVVALHRAVHLAKQNPEARVLLTTFSQTLARQLRTKIARLVGDAKSVGERIAVRAIDAVGLELYEAEHGRAIVPTPRMMRSLFEEASKAAGDHRFSMRFSESEWNEVVDAWQIGSWEEYRDVPRLGRKTRLGEKQRETLWQIFDRVRHDLRGRGLATMPMVFGQATEIVRDGEKPIADHIVIDEAQDVGVPQLRFLAAVAAEKNDGLFFAGDLGQRIFQPPFSWKSLGVDVRGRSHTLRINYRTSHQIRAMADRLLPPELADVDGVSESRRGTISAFNGSPPEIRLADLPSDEVRLIADRLKRWMGEEGLQPHEIAIFVRSAAELDRAKKAVAASGQRFTELDAGTDLVAGTIAVSTMHLAKGLEFRAVIVAACDEDVLPSQQRIEQVGDDADLNDILNTERHLLYVACTRARDHLLVTGVEPGSEYLEDLGGV